MPGPLTVALAVAVAGVVGYCLARAVRPALRPADHHPDVDAWHVTLGLAMIAMLLTPLSGALATVTVLASAAGLGWALARLLRRAARPAYLRLAAGAAAMAAMVLLPSTATASAPASAGGHGHGGAVAAGAVVLVPLLLLLLMLVVAGRMLDAARRAEPLPESLDACCDVAMAGATGYLLVLML
jgi:hypothetical protein